VHDVTRTLTAHYDACLAAHGRSARGMDWGDDERTLELRFATVCRATGLDAATTPVAILDAGCGAGLLLDHLGAHHAGCFAYHGVDASPAMLEAARTEHPQARWTYIDVAGDEPLPEADWVVANGLFTERRDVPEPVMRRWCEHVIERLFAACRVGVVFNVLSSHVNFRDPVLFYWDPADVLAFAVGRLSRHVTIHHDLAIYEYFATIRRTPWTPPGETP
jgi:SAM-dependent methyltransferase